MKNLKVSMKLIVSFLIVAALAAIVGIVGIVGLLTIDTEYSLMYENNLVPLPYLSNVTTLMQRIRVNMREFALGAYAGDQAEIDTARTNIDAYQLEMTTNLDAYAALISNPAVDTRFKEARASYDTDFKALIETCYNLALAGDGHGVVAALTEGKVINDTIVESFNWCMDTEVSDANTVSTVNTDMANMLLWVVVGVLILAVVIAMVLAFYISGLISNPLKVMMSYIKQAGETGNLEFTEEQWSNCDRLSLIKDEIGQTMKAFTAMLHQFVYYGEQVSEVAQKNLTIEVKTLGDDDTFGNAIKGMVADLSGMFSEIKMATAQVSTGSTQIADGAQALAQGSTEQSATVEELSAAIAEIATKTHDNALMAEDAANLATTIMQNAEKGSRQMDEMTTAVNEINTASQNISKVIKVIDDIAFQTNILALNAAVEAARAGQHGKGFAVVADEVRNLAAKSAEAAKDTGTLIANSMEKAELGARIAADTAASLVDIVTGINDSNQIVAKIAESSEEQNVGIRQINDGIDQVAQVVQQNSATAEESAAASEELSSQATMLEQLISQFRLRDTFGGSSYRSSPSPSSHSSSESSFALSSGSTGKY